MVYFRVIPSNDEVHERLQVYLCVGSFTLLVGLY